MSSEDNARVSRPSSSYSWPSDLRQVFVCYLKCRRAGVAESDGLGRLPRGLQSGGGVGLLLAF